MFRYLSMDFQIGVTGKERAAMYIIRADGNAKIGAGHLMRCMTIAGELAEIDGGRDGILFL